MQDNRGGEIFNEVVLREQATVASALEKHSWQFAKTMPKNPHWYTLKKNWELDEFNNTVIRIREWGRDEWFWGSLYRYWDVNGFHYWTMGDTLDGTILINRKPTEYRTAKDNRVMEYGDLQVKNLVQSVTGVLHDYADIQPSHSVLDVNCGAGIFHDAFGDLAPKSYFGIDRSSEAIETAKKKHPHVEYRTCGFEHVRCWQKFDRVLFLLGAPNRIATMELKRVPTLLTEGGKAVLMWFNQEAGYFGEGSQRQFQSPGVMANYYDKQRTVWYVKHIPAMVWDNQYLVEIVEFE